MNRLSRALLLAALLGVMPTAASAQSDLRSMSSEALLTAADDMHPAGYFYLAAKLFNEGEREEASKWLYIAQIRYRFHLRANPDLAASGDQALFASLMETVGRPINEYAAGDFDAWLESMDAALAWDEANPNGFTSKEEHAEALEQTRAGLTQLRASLVDERSEIESYRRLNGLPIR